LNFFQKILQKAGPIMSAVHSLFSYIIVLAVFGYLLDKRYNTFPLLFLIALFIGLMVGFYQLSRTVNLKKKI